MMWEGNETSCLMIALVHKPSESNMRQFMSAMSSTDTDNIYNYNTLFLNSSYVYKHEASRLSCNIPDLTLCLEMKDCSGNSTVIICMQSVMVIRDSSNKLLYE